MSHTRRRFRIPPSRSLVLDVLHFSRALPNCEQDRLCDVTPLVKLRRETHRRISWPAIFLKAYALTAAEHPRLRQTWMQWPWPHIYQHDEDVASLALQRHFEGDDWLFWGRIRDLSSKPLGELQEEIEGLQTKPVEEIFDKALWLARRSWPIRRAIWWSILHIFGWKKCDRLGTFFLTTVSGTGAEIQNPPSFLTSGLTFGPIDDRGITRVTVSYDHRLIDGKQIGQVLEQLERTLQTHIVSELEQLVAEDPDPDADRRITDSRRWDAVA